MKTISLIIPTVGIIDLDDMLNTLYNPESSSSFDEVIVCVDVEARNKIKFPEKKLDLNRMKEKYPKIKWMENNEKPWEMMNQTINLAIQASISDFIMITHDDCYFPKFTCPMVGNRTNFDYAAKAREELDKITDPKCIGVAFHFINMLNFLDTRGRFIFRTAYTPITTVLDKHFIETMGYLNTSYGIYYDWLISREMELRGLYCKVIEDAPSIFHKISRSYHYTDNFGGYATNMKWSQLEDNYKRYQEDRANETAVPYEKLKSW